VHVFMSSLHPGVWCKVREAAFNTHCQHNIYILLSISTLPFMQLCRKLPQPSQEEQIRPPQ